MDADRIDPLAEPRRIVGFHQDEEGQWVAELSCGHTRHVRHNPPWEVRAWTLTAEGRASRLGEALSCRDCDENEGEQETGGGGLG